MEIIRQDVAQDKIRIDNPTQNLESYFLEVVQNARKAAAETSGATSGARVAEYLRGDAENRPTADKILERLTLPQAAPAVSAATPEPAPTVDQRKIDSLTRPVAALAQPSTDPAPEEKTADLEKSNEKLSTLLGKPKE